MHAAKQDRARATNAAGYSDFDHRGDWKPGPMYAVDPQKQTADSITMKNAPNPELRSISIANLSNRNIRPLASSSITDFQS